MSNLYFYTLNGVKQNAVSEDELISLAKSGVINRNTLIWRQGYSDWITLSESEIDTSFLPPPVINAPNFSTQYETANPPGKIVDIKEKFEKYVIENVKNAFNYRGRTSRASYWHFILFNFLILIILSLLAIPMKELGSILILIYSLASIIVQISLQVRRLHDVGHSGWWVLAPIVPLIFSLQPSQLIENEYGHVPNY